MGRDLTRIGERARQGSREQFTSIYHYVTDLDHLRACYADLPAKSAAGVDGVTKEEYGLGFTHYCGHTRNGRFKVKRKTSAKKFRAKLRETKEWLQRERSHLKKGALLRRAKLKLQGHLN